MANSETSEEMQKDAARYRFLRQSETTMGPAQEQAYGEMWLRISKKGCDGEKMDRAVDEGIVAFEAATKQDEETP